VLPTSVTHLVFDAKNDLGSDMFRCLTNRGVHYARPLKRRNSGFEQSDNPFCRCKDACSLTQFSRVKMLIKQRRRRAA